MWFTTISSPLPPKNALFSAGRSSALSSADTPRWAKPVWQGSSVGGAAPAPYFPQNVYVQISGVGYRYAAQNGDTAATVAAGLQALISVDWPSASVAGAIVTLPATARIEALRRAQGRDPAQLDFLRFQLRVPLLERPEIDEQRDPLHHGDRKMVIALGTDLVVAVDFLAIHDFTAVVALEPHALGAFGPRRHVGAGRFLFFKPGHNRILFAEPIP